MEFNLNWRYVRELHDELGDPFVMIPIRGASFSLKQALFDANESFNEYMGPYGVSRKFWTVPCELIHEEKGMIIGNAFVLAQVAIAQAVSIFVKLRESSVDQNRYPKSKNGIVSYQSKNVGETDFSEVAVIDAMANYFKHYHEWPDDWDENSAKGVQKNTLQLIKSIGLSPGELTINMERGLYILDIFDNDLGKLCDIVSQWRESLSSDLSKDSNIANCL